MSDRAPIVCVLKGRDFKNAIELVRYCCRNKEHKAKILDMLDDYNDAHKTMYMLCVNKCYNIATKVISGKLKISQEKTKHIIIEKTIKTGCEFDIFNLNEVTGHIMNTLKIKPREE